MKKINFLDSGSLRNLLNNGSSKRQKGSKASINEMEEMIKQIIKEETGSNPKRQRNPPKKKSESKPSKSTFLREPVIKNREKLKASRIAKNNIQIIGNLYGLSNDDISYLERQFSFLEKFTDSIESKLMQGYDDLCLVDDSNFEFSIDHCRLLLKYINIDIEENIFQELCTTSTMDVNDTDHNNTNEIIDFSKWSHGLVSKLRQRFIAGILSERRGEAPLDYLKTEVTATSTFDSIHSAMEIFSQSQSQLNASISEEILSDNQQQQHDQSLLFSDPKKSLRSLSQSNLLASFNSSYAAKTMDSNNNSMSFRKGGSSTVTLKTEHLLPTLKISKSLLKQKAMKRKLMTTGGFDQFLGRSTPRVLNENNGAVSVDMLRAELKLAQDSLEMLNTLVDSNIAWVHSNCDITSHLGNISTQTKDRCKKLAVEKFVSALSSYLENTKAWAFIRLRKASTYVRMQHLAVNYSKAKAVQCIANILSDVCYKQFLRKFTHWVNEVRVEVYWEREAAACDIQKVIRRFLGKLRAFRVRLGVSALSIQCCIRMKIARKKTQEKLEQKILAYKTAAVEVIQKFYRGQNDIKLAKAEAKRRREIKASRRIEAVFRGHQGRQRFIRIKHEALMREQEEREAAERPSTPDDVRAAAAIEAQRKREEELQAQAQRELEEKEKERKKAENIRKREEAKRLKREEDEARKRKEREDKLALEAKAEMERKKYLELEALKNLDLKLEQDENEDESIPIRNETEPEPVVLMEPLKLPADNDDGDAGLSDADLQAAIKIQSIARGKVARKQSVQMLNSKKSQVVNHAASSSHINIHSHTTKGAATSSKPQLLSRPASNPVQHTNTAAASKHKTTSAAAAAVTKNTTPRSKNDSARRSITPVDDNTNTNKNSLHASKNPPTHSTQSNASTTNKIASPNIKSNTNASVTVTPRTSSVTPRTSVTPRNINDATANTNATPRSARAIAIPIKASSTSTTITKDDISHTDLIPNLSPSNNLVEILPSNEDSDAFTLDAIEENSIAHDNATSDKSNEEPKDTKLHSHADANDNDEVLPADNLHDTNTISLDNDDNDEMDTETLPAPVAKEPADENLPQIKTDTPQQINSSGASDDRLPRPSTGNPSSVVSSDTRPSTTSRILRSLGNWSRPTAVVDAEKDESRPKETDRAASPSNSRASLLSYSAGLFSGMKSVLPSTKSAAPVGSSIPVHGATTEQKLPIPENVVMKELPSADVAVERIQRGIRSKLARKRVAARRAVAMKRQARAGQMVHWAVVTIQRIARARRGRRKFRAHAVAVKRDRAQRQVVAATRIQGAVRRMIASIRMAKLREAWKHEVKLAQWKKYGKDSNDKDKDGKKKSNNKKIKGGSGDDDDGNDYNNAGGHSAQLKEVEEKLKRLEMLERAMVEKEQRMTEATRLSEERALAMERALREIDDKLRADEAEKAARRNLLDMAAGPISTQRSEYGTVPAPALASARGSSNTGRRGLNPNSARYRENPPTARSARDPGGIPLNAERFTYEGKAWVQLWDPAEQLYYWFCEATQEAHWERPDQVQARYDSGYESAGAMTDYSTDYSTGPDFSDSEYDGSGTGGLWSVYFDEQAQAKYWYNSQTGEATWTKPTGLRGDASSRGGSTQVSARSAPSSSRAGDNASDWVSYLDEETGQEYWYNAKTGETSWS